MKTCNQCGSTDFYLDGRCKPCRRKQNLASYHRRSGQAKKAKVSKRKELLGIIKHHKQNPQFSCVRWG